MRILDWKNLDEVGRREALARPQCKVEEHFVRSARDATAHVRRDGDAALRALTERFDGMWLESPVVTAREFAEARRALTRDQIEALERAIANVHRFHEAQVLEPFTLETEAGVRCEELVRPILSPARADRARLGRSPPAASRPSRKHCRVLVTDIRGLAEEVGASLQRQRGELKRQGILTHSLAACQAIVVPDLDTGTDIVNAHAPEHLMLQVREPRRWLAEIQNAGSVFLGPWSAETLGDYCSGTNHVLPTYGHARAMGVLSVRDFVKTMPVQEVSTAGLRALGPTAITLAGLDGHANAIARQLAAVSVEAIDARKVELPAGVYP
jgi:histidinol dehydrogenase